MNKHTVFLLKSTLVLFCLNPGGILHAQNDSIQEMEEIVVEGTRSSKSIADIPTRVEVLTEEIDESATMDPSKIAHLLTHSTGIQVQTTSAASNTANVRIQGLDGKYTQILKDGFPLYGGFTGSLSIMQIPPLDLRQIEYIKGGASTLYGAGAISGLINLISKDPMKEEHLLHVNASHVGAFDLNSYVSRKKGKIGFSILAQRNSHAMYDVNGDGFTDLPNLVKYNLNPRLRFNITDRIHLVAGATFTDEIRKGGDTHLVRGEQPDSLHFFFEGNDVKRVTSQLKLECLTVKDRVWTLKNSVSRSYRDMNSRFAPLQTTRFTGIQLSSFSEVTYGGKWPNTTFIAGANVYTHEFRELRPDSFPARDEESITLGAFVQFTYTLFKKIHGETGMRLDAQSNRELFWLPRSFFLIKWTENITTRFGGGMGYRTPTLFNQEAEQIYFRNVLPVSDAELETEMSAGGSIDIGMKFPIGKHYFISFNQMFFLTRVNRPLQLADTGFHSGIYHYKNFDGMVRSHGAETFLKFGFFKFVFFAGYTYTNAFLLSENSGYTTLPLTPQHSLKGDLLYSLPGKWRIGADYEYKGAQKLSDGRTTPGIWTFGTVVEYTYRQYTFFGNAENITDVRQTRYENMIRSPHFTPQYTEVWAPLDGFVFNAGIKLRL